MSQLCSVVIFDNFVVFVCRLLVVFHTDLYYVINVIGIYIYQVCCMGLDALLVVTFSWGEPLCVKVLVTLVGVYLGMITCFRARLCWGGGG